MEAGAACTPFKVHLGVTLPPPPPAVSVNTDSALPNNWEYELSHKISKIKTQESFAELYQQWLQKHSGQMSDVERYNWLSCLNYYVNFDTNKNGIPDWSAISDFQPATNLYPQDPDQDGDGIINILDPNPLKAERNPAQAITLSKNTIPQHLKISEPERAETARLQQELYTEFGILAVDHTDRQSLSVLSELLFLLRNGFTKAFVKSLHLKYIYAFSGHDPSRNIAAYHWQAQALSVAGIQSYREAQLSPRAKMELLAALSHEVGHAVLFDKLKTKELLQISQKFSDWTAAKKISLQRQFFSPVFFEAYPFDEGKNIVSHYAMKNRHEWFAESFSASILNSLGESGKLGEQWKKSLTRIDFSGSDYWSDYTQISRDFRRWFKALITR